MANLGGGLAGAGVGFATGGVPGAILGGISGFLGGGQSEDPIMRQQRQFQQQIAQQQLGYARSVPGSSSDELANLSQARGNLGAQQRTTQQRAFSAYSPSQGLPAGQMMANLQNAFTAQNMANQSGFLQDAAANRRQALLQAASTGMNAANLYRPQQSQFPAMAQQLSQMLAYQRARGGGAAAGGAVGGYPDPNAPGNQIGADAAWNSAGGGGPQAPIDWAGIGASGQLGSPASIQAFGGAPGGGAAPGAMPGQMPPGMLQMLAAMLSQQMAGAMPQQQQLAPQQQGAAAPGNGPFGTNSQANQIRQASGISNIYGGNQHFDPAQINQMLRQLILPGGIRMNF